jgi:acyl-CoA hydrolase
VPHLFTATCPPDVVVIHTSAPADGMLSLGIEVNILPAAIEAARAHGGVVIAIANPHMPYTHGESLVDLRDIDYLVEIDEPLQVVAERAPDPISAEIGSRISSHIHSGSTLQLGIGGVPDAVLGALCDARDLRIWSETISDGVLALERAGALDPDEPVRPSFMMGSNELYAWADNNPRVSMLRTERCNSPGLIAKNHAMTSVNAALEVDLHGQANASRIKGRIFSGFGGSTDFIVGALHSSGGRAFIALPSWHPKAQTSTIVAALDVPATHFQQSAVVTEQGIAWLLGSSEQEQADHLIEHAAHPDARPGLREAAAKMFAV